MFTALAAAWVLGMWPSNENKDSGKKQESWPEPEHLDKYSYF